MTVIIVSRVTPALRGRLTRWMLQVHPGVFVGTLSPRVRERLWDQVSGSRRTGACMMIARANNEQGFTLDSSLDDASRIPIDFDGLLLVERLGDEAKPLGAT
jgi:CRISPR-associated protein Cas2